MTRRLTTGFGRAGIGILVSLACIFLVLRGVDLRQTANLLGSARPPWRSWRWQAWVPISSSARCAGSA